MDIHLAVLEFLYATGGHIDIKPVDSFFATSLLMNVKSIVTITVQDVVVSDSASIYSFCASPSLQLEM